MLEGLLRHTKMVKGVVVQWGTEQVVVVLQEDEGLGVAECTRQGVVLQKDEGLGVAECTRKGVVLQEDEGLGVVEGRTWDRGLEVAEDKMYGIGGQHIVQSGRQPLVAYFEGESRDEFGPWVAAWERLHLLYLMQ